MFKGEEDMLKYLLSSTLKDHETTRKPQDPTFMGLPSPGFAKGSRKKEPLNQDAEPYALGSSSIITQGSREP